MCKRVNRSTVDYPAGRDKGPKASEEAARNEACFRNLSDGYRFEMVLIWLVTLPIHCSSLKDSL